MSDRRLQVDRTSPPLSKKTLRIGVLLPLSGENQRWGEYIKRSIEGAIQALDGIEVLYADTQGEAHFAVQAIDQWQSKDHPIEAILGPLSPTLAIMVAQRAQWYETPWFPLGSLPSLVKNSFTISWRLEAEDEGRSIGDAVCERRPSTAALLFDDSPRSQLGIRTLIRSLKRCGVKVIHRVRLARGRGKVSDRTIDEALLKLSGRAGSEVDDPWWSRINPRPHHPAQRRAPRVRYEALVTTLRGRLLARTISQFPLWDIEIKPHSSRRVREIYSKYRDEEPPWVQLYTGIGARSVATGAVSPHLLEGAVMMDRASLSLVGRNYLKRRPRATPLELELRDLFTWLHQVSQHRGSLNVTTQSPPPLLQLLQRYDKVNGVWGQRSFRHGQLVSPPLKQVTLHQGKLRALMHH